MTPLLRDLAAFFEAGGTVMPYLLAVSIVLWTMIVERWLYLFGPVRIMGGWNRGAGKHEISLFESAAVSFLSTRTPEASTLLHDFCVKKGGEMARFVHRALIENDSSSHDAIALSLDEASLNYSMKIRRGLRVIAMLSTVAPMLGLLGTVSGMIEAFNNMMVTGGGDAASLSGGISAALITTQVGLVVALPGMFTRSVFTRRADALEDAIFLLSTRIRCAFGECRKRECAAGGEL